MTKCKANIQRWDQTKHWTSYYKPHLTCWSGSTVQVRDICKTRNRRFLQFQKCIYLFWTGRIIQCVIMKRGGIQRTKKSSLLQSYIYFQRINRIISNIRLVLSDLRPSSKISPPKKERNVPTLFPRKAAAELTTNTSSTPFKQTVNIISPCVSRCCRLDRSLTWDSSNRRTDCRSRIDKKNFKYL